MSTSTELSMLIARVLGAYFLIICLCVIVNEHRYHKIIKELTKDHALMYMSGLAHMVGGLIMVSLHNRWFLDQYLLVTVIAWSFLVKGTLMLLFPEPLARFSVKTLHGRWQTLGAVVGLLLAIALLHLGFYQTALI